MAADSTLPVFAPRRLPQNLPTWPFSLNAFIRIVNTDDSPQAYATQGGTNILTAFSGTMATIRVEYVLRQALPGDVATAPGSFTLNGSITVALKQNQP
jgi:hypothetical protein